MLKSTDLYVQLIYKVICIRNFACDHFKLSTFYLNSFSHHKKYICFFTRQQASVLLTEQNRYFLNITAQFMRIYMYVAMFITFLSSLEKQNQNNMIFLSLKVQISFLFFLNKLNVCTVFIFMIGLRVDIYK